MKKNISLIILLSATAFYAQVKKAPNTVVTPILAKSANATLQMVKNNVYLLLGNGAKKDSIIVATKKDKIIPTNCKITPITPKGITLYCVSWTENVVTETKNKKENATINESQIWNPINKTMLIGNTQKSTKITETVFLDRLKNASETQEKVRNEGYVFTLLPNAEFSLKNKSTESVYFYNTKSGKYETKR